MGAVPADVLWIGDAPSSTEETIGKALGARDRAYLSELFVEVSRRVGRDVTWHMSPVLLCRPTNGASDRLPSTTEILSCFANVDEIFHTVVPGVVTLSGDVAQAAYKKEYPDHAKVPALRVIQKYPGLWATTVQTIVDAVNKNSGGHVVR